jgi:HSP20 family molecular chaperone IbpA
MSAQSLETNDMMVVTVHVPTTSAEELSVDAAGHRVTIRGPGDFRHALLMPEAADVDRLHAGLFCDILELRAPRGTSPGDAIRRLVPVQQLS